MFNNLGPGEILVIAIVILVLFGGSKLPEIARGLGTSAKELKKVKTEIERTLKDIKDEGDQQPSTSTQEKITKGGEFDNA